MDQPIKGSGRDLISRLREERKRQGLTIEEVSERTGIIAQSISRLENSVDPNPRERTLQRLATALGVEIQVTNKSQRRSHVLTFYNASGGSGKSTLVREIGALLAERGFEVLLIDTDPQATLTYSLGVRAANISPADTILPAMFALMSDSAAPDPRPLERFGMDLIPAHGALSGLDAQLRDARYFALLEGYLERFRDNYDFVFLDTNPFPGGLVSACIRASDEIVVPISAEIKSTWGYSEATKFVQALRSSKPNLRIALFVLNQMDGTSHAKDIERWARANLVAHAPVSRPVASRPAVFKDAMLGEHPIVAFRPQSRAKDALRDLNEVTDHLLKELGVTHG